MSITWYICKYTPVELLEALGGTCRVLDHMPERFDRSDEVSHPNLCGFGKAVLEACLEGEVRELVLANCCDTIRSVYDVLLAHGELDFLFLMDLAHCGDCCSGWRRPTPPTRGRPFSLRAFGRRSGPSTGPLSPISAFWGDGWGTRCSP